MIELSQAERTILEKSIKHPEPAVRGLTYAMLEKLDLPEAVTLHTINCSWPQGKAWHVDKRIALTNNDVYFYIKLQRSVFPGGLVDSLSINSLDLRNRKGLLMRFHEGGDYDFFYARRDRYNSEEVEWGVTDITRWIDQGLEPNFTGKPSLVTPSYRRSMVSIAHKLPSIPVNEALTHKMVAVFKEYNDAIDIDI